MVGIGVGVVGGVLSGALLLWMQERKAAVATVACVNMLFQIDGAKEQWALENHKSNGAQMTWDEIRDYFKSRWNDKLPWDECPGGGHQTIGPIGQLPSCSIKRHQAAFEAQFKIHFPHHLEWPGFSGFLRDPEWRRIGNARVQLEDSSDRRLVLVTEWHGGIAGLPDDWTNPIVRVSISKPGYEPATFTGPFEYHRNEFVLSRKVLTDAEAEVEGGLDAFNFVRDIELKEAGWVTRDVDARVVRLVLEEEQCRATNVAIVAKLPSLRELVLSGRLFAPLPRGLLDREGIQALSSCPELSTLVLSGHGELRPGVLPAIAELPHLRRLQMFETLIPLQEEPVLASLSRRIEVTVRNTPYSTKLRRAAGRNP